MRNTPSFITFFKLQSPPILKEPSLQISKLQRFLFKVSKGEIEICKEKAIACKIKLRIVKQNVEAEI